MYKAVNKKDKAVPVLQGWMILALVCEMLSVGNMFGLSKIMSYVKVHAKHIWFICSDIWHKFWSAYTQMDSLMFNLNWPPAMGLRKQGGLTPIWDN